MKTHIFGIRHHGPGCAHSLRMALEALQPDIVLVEGPPDAQEVLPLLMHEGMRPPVALLIYMPDDPKRAVYYPFTHFSPEWQALRYAFEHGIPGRFMDLPQAIHMAKEPDEVLPTADGEQSIKQLATAGTVTEPTDTLPMDDPLAMLAIAAGYTDHELWWERQIEQRRDSSDLFAGILEAMTALRADMPPKNEEEMQREAHMRQMIRAAEQEGFERIAVVCGAWHAPVLVPGHSAKEDAALLHKLKRVKVEATWIPWTNARLSYRSGYGAGVTSPGWYEHLWTTQDKIVIRWLTRAAHLLREQGLDTSSASVIEATRLSEALAALRDLPMPGLAELHESIETVLCNGNAEPMQLIRERLEIGDRLGEVPPETPAVPLQRDLEAQQRRLRLKPSTTIETLDLDLRKDTDRARSQLLHQLRLLKIEWGEPRQAYGKSGTFHELWKTQWQVEFVLALIDKNIWGNTIEQAATSFIGHIADTTTELPKLTELLDEVILAGLPAAIEHLLGEVQRRAAISSDVRHMMDALPPLARVARYGNVRGTQTEQITPIIDGLFERILVGLPNACSSLDDDAAQLMVESIAHAQESVSLLHRADQLQEWLRTLRSLMEQERIHGFVRGFCCRQLLEQQGISEEELQGQARLSLSTAVPAPQAAAWIEGVLRGSGLVVLHQDGLWRVLDSWLSEQDTDVFEGLLPLLRRAFAGFQAPERRAMGEKVRHLHSTALVAPGMLHTHDGEEQPFQGERAQTMLPVLAHILGVNVHEH